MAERKRSSRRPKPPTATEVGGARLSGPRLTLPSSRRPTFRRPTRVLPRSSSQPLLRTVRFLLDPTFQYGIEGRSALILSGLQASFHSTPRDSFSFDVTLIGGLIIIIKNCICWFFGSGFAGGDKGCGERDGTREPWPGQGDGEDGGQSGGSDRSGGGQVEQGGKECLA
ncbi:hypothetical protein ZIOFF_073963 [Zingiber officinale]|uniref:Uncharacterized protein n=1 Tax=Zingiber officinale TaxID=94328 RepID=A0A8J5ETY3_ZINOF|nr:hypothetical protein ZIOFF_073963 [Zingiber officinale]